MFHFIEQCLVYKKGLVAGKPHVNVKDALACAFYAFEKERFFRISAVVFSGELQDVAISERKRLLSYNTESSQTNAN